MKATFNHYYKFKVSCNQNGFLDLVCKKGCYNPLEERKSGITKLVINQMTNIYCNHSKNGQLSLLNPFCGEIIGLGELNDSTDTVIVIYNFKKETVEFFISESTYKGSMMILELVKQEELTNEMNFMRKNAIISI